MRFNPDTERGITFAALAAAASAAAAAPHRPTFRVQWRSPYTGELRHQGCSSRAEAVSLAKYYESCGSAAQIVS